MTTLDKPWIISSWVWYDPRMADADLWRNCLVAATNANARDPVTTAQKMYKRHGGEEISYTEVARRKRAARNKQKKGDMNK